MIRDITQLIQGASLPCPSHYLLLKRAHAPHVGNHIIHALRNQHDVCLCCRLMTFDPAINAGNTKASDIVACEVAILEILDWNIVVATSWDFVECYGTSNGLGFTTPQDRCEVTSPLRPRNPSDHRCILY